MEKFGIIPEKIYLVIREEGSYDDYEHKAVISFTNRNDADEFIEEANIALDKLIKKQEEIMKRYTDEMKENRSDISKLYDKMDEEIEKLFYSFKYENLFEKYEYNNGCTGKKIIIKSDNICPIDSPSKYFITEVELRGL